MAVMGIKDATQAAAGFAEAAFPRGHLNVIRLEEVELSSDGCWLITLSWIDPDRSKGIFSTLGEARPRTYKVFRVDQETGEVLSMKIREMNAGG